MTLATELRKANIDWCIDLVYINEPSVRYPEKQNRVQKLRIRLADMSVESSESAPVTMETLIQAERTDRDIEHLLALAMRRNMPDHPVFQTWLKSRGHEPVTIRPDLLGESLGECIHTALRKCVDTHESCIQYQSIHQLAGADWLQLLEMTRENIRALMKKVEIGTLPSLQRYDVGLAIKNAFADRADEVTHREDPKTRRPVKRADAESFALMSLTMACKITDDQDFVWGWTSYLCEYASESNSQTPAKRERQTA